MSGLSAEERGDLVQRLLPIAGQLTTLVHGDGGQRDIHQVIARLTADERDNLLVVLAGLVNPDVPMSALLGWLTFDEHGNPVKPEVATDATLRDLAEEVWDEAAAEGDFIDDAAVQQYLAGKPVTVTDAERIAAIAEATRRGITYLQLDQLQRLPKNTTSKFVSLARKAAEARGEEFPIPQHGNAAVSLSEEQVLEIRRRAATRTETDEAISLSFGVTRKTISAIAVGDTYRQFGGPIRPKKTSRPTARQRVEFAGGTPAAAQAS
ncbi:MULTISPECIES: hypothetical protein [unclassified Streptomyces]|uniref:hypothetical protein n=1 Tax=unclassified Streptomyces TaxID=2593676 RepID=UPI000883F9CB|nr:MULTISPECIES: hypothetical protein [unclassified Streptomyces]PBC72321.1 hypothetical protein BX261_7405 [Streptomyces sp. 2321.6]SDR62175.1 hypothetical protein SAMN05216511_7298 [Streptomyces sp. KS_16]SEE50829.1 hypothetical protein SAMN05428940_7347 [Streptomyces sp. 2133.1]SNC77825.1 hypothetical protein SAMN06272741_7241 [Streptomyces sp. 2114.4]